MSRIQTLAAPVVPDLTIDLSSPGAMSLAGTLATREPREDVLPFLRAVHEAVLAEGLSEFRVDVTRLTFVNSSAIRLFVDWATWLKSAERGYTLTFVSNPKITWQRTTFAVLKSLAGSVVRTETAP